MTYDTIPLFLCTLGCLMLGVLALVQWTDEHVNATATHTP